MKKINVGKVSYTCAVILITGLITAWSVFFINNYYQEKSLKNGSTAALDNLTESNGNSQVVQNVVERQVVTQEEARIEAINKVSPAIVGVVNFANNATQGEGSGIIYKKDGKDAYIVTNQHVIDKGDYFEVVFSNGEHAEATLIGGDIYTIPKVLRKKRKYLFYNSLVDFCNRAIKKGKPVIVYGASVGPWGEYKVAVNYYINALSKYKAILCRERESVAYLRKFGFKNVLFFPDPAFQVRGENKYVKKKYIGINLSPLAFNEVYGNHGIVYIKGLAKLMDLLWEKYEIDILFIPHVISKAPDDNDLWFMEKIKDNMRYKNHVQIADVSKGFLGAKEHIAECRAVIAARMHCAINAVEENIPTIFVSYSQKSIGMCKYIYGDCDMLVDLQRMDQDLFKVLDKALEGEENIARRLKLRNDEIQQYYRENVEHIKEILSIKNG